MATEIKATRAKRRENIGPYDVEAEGKEKAPYRSQKQAKAAGMVRTYEAGRILTIGDSYRQPGELVPEAVTWFRLMNIVHMGYLKSVEVSIADFNAAVQKYCPELAEEIDRHIEIVEE